MSFRVSGLDPAPFQHLYGLSNEALATHGAQRYVADAKPGFPDRIEVRDAEPGEMLLLLNYEHQPAQTPYRASHAIFVRDMVGGGSLQLLDGMAVEEHVIFDSAVLRPAG